MRAFTISLAQLFKMDSRLGGSQNFIETKRKLLIPMYQREYKWTTDRILTLLNDIKAKNKFLGNIILDELDDCYEVVDGQQRLTTCMLILAALYSKYCGKPMEQEFVMGLLKPFGSFLLQNDSIKDYLLIDNGTISVSIDSTNDIYRQKEAFKSAYDVIRNFFDGFADHDTLSDFQRKFCSCQFLILINDNHDYVHSVEQLFLDINEKAQLLSEEDIFKGHCFEKYSQAQRNHLKELWVKLKTLSFSFQNFGIKDMGQYIYLYLLENDKNDLPKSLSQSGKHYLDNKSMDEIDSLLQDMIKYGESIVAFNDNLNKADYRFVNICKDGNGYSNTEDHIILKFMCRSILIDTKTTYQKLPFLYLIHHITKTENGDELCKYKDFRKIITNLYIYSTLFSLSNIKKSKTIVDLTLRDALRTSTPNSALNAVRASRTLRQTQTGPIEIDSKFTTDKMQFIYSIIDYFNADKEWLESIHLISHSQTNKEHFIIPQRSKKIEWKINDNDSYKFPIADNVIKDNKTKTVNLIFLNKTLNENLRSYDVVYKIKKIKEWYAINGSIPKHVSIFIEYIESLSEYQKLIELKTKSPTQDEITTAYNSFIIKYFESENEILEKINTSFLNSFRNN